MARLERALGAIVAFPRRVGARSLVAGRARLELPLRTIGVLETLLERAILAFAARGTRLELALRGVRIAS